MVNVDWEALKVAAEAACERAYAPYSKYPVGAAGVDASGLVYSGCNVENVSSGLTLCAECSMVSAFVAGGGSTLVGVVVVDGSGSLIMPCGRCRQVLWEFGGSGVSVLSGSGVLSLGSLLPHAFER